MCLSVWVCHVWVDAQQGKNKMWDLLEQNSATELWWWLPSLLSEIEQSETALLSSLELMDSGLTAWETAWYQPRHSACWLLCSFVCCGIPRSGIRTCRCQSSCLGNLFLQLNCLAQPWCGRRNLVLPHLVVLYFIDTHGKPLCFWSEWRWWRSGCGGGWQMGGGTGEKEEMVIDM